MYSNFNVTWLLLKSAACLSISIKSLNNWFIKISFLAAHFIKNCSNSNLRLLRASAELTLKNDFPGILGKFDINLYKESWNIWKSLNLLSNVQVFWDFLSVISTW